MMIDSPLHQEHYKYQSSVNRITSTVLVLLCVANTVINYGWGTTHFWAKVLTIIVGGVLATALGIIALYLLLEAGVSAINWLKGG